MNRIASDVQLSQTSFEDMCPIKQAIDDLAASGVEARGAIYTRREVVEFILDLIGYRSDKALYNHRLLEPSFGEGDFLLVVVERLLAAWQRYRPKGDPLERLKDCIRGVELHESSFSHTRAKILGLLEQADFRSEVAESLVDSWLIKGDFLLAPLPEEFDCVVGNPPYVRQERIPGALIKEYRSRYVTIFDRADIYIPFIERSLTLLSSGGRLGFICADRWMKNRYGRRLRQFVADRFHLRIYVDMVDTPAFNQDVIAYPAITIIANENQGKTRIACRPEVSKRSLNRLAKTLMADELVGSDITVKELADVAASSEPWILGSLDQLTLVRRLESEFPAIEESGCQVGIGVATGADKAFIGAYSELDVEADRKLPLVMTHDILSGEVCWRGRGVVNPFADEGGLVDLEAYPKLKQYLEARKDQIARRHVAQKAPANWYRTIDRIYPSLAERPKLLIPDIKGEAHIVYEKGELYPHHNLYYVTSEQWDLRALQAVLRSDVTRLFVSIYSTQMRGGYLRFQAQYLRRIRLPKWQDVATSTRRELIAAAEQADMQACNDAAFKLYGLSNDERAVLGGNGEK